MPGPRPRARALRARGAARSRRTSSTSTRARGWSAALSYDAGEEPRFWFVLDLAIAREHGIALAGPPSPRGASRAPARAWSLEALRAGAHLVRGRRRRRRPDGARGLSRLGVGDRRRLALEGRRGAWARGRLPDPGPVDRALARRGDADRAAADAGASATRWSAARWPRLTAARTRTVRAGPGATDAVAGEAHDELEPAAQRAAERHARGEAAALASRARRAEIVRRPVLTWTRHRPAAAGAARHARRAQRAGRACGSGTGARRSRRGVTEHAQAPARPALGCRRARSGRRRAVVAGRELARC